MVTLASSKLKKTAVGMEARTVLQWNQHWIGRGRTTDRAVRRAEIKAARDGSGRHNRIL